jgi:predicted transcriptional regulator
MPYDAKLDKQLFSKFIEDEDDKLTVSVYSYNNGAKKLQISRESKDAEGNLRFAKMGRLTKAELQAILPFLQEALSHMD